MSCSSCGTKSGGGCSPAGCKNNGTCGTSGCNALNVYDWFSDMELPDQYERFNIVEIHFKGSRKEYYRNTSNLDLYIGDTVITESNIGVDYGTVSATGEIVRLQLRKKHIDENNAELKAILRKATDFDTKKYNEAKLRESKTLERARTIGFDLKLEMKLSDIEIQGDGRKATFFYTAESRVDFREMIKRFADEFKTKIEMRHISYREEASRLGGIGVCGRQLCCSTWLTDYKQVNTGAARIQNLSINVEKLAGQCGKLKCCLNFELDLYVEILEEFPKAKILKFETEDGPIISRKSDILKKVIWFSQENSQTWVAISIDKIKEFSALAEEGKKIPKLSDIASASQVMEQIAASSEFISNNELLQEDEEFATELRNQHRSNKNKKKKNQHFGNKPNVNPENRNAGNPGNKNFQNNQNRPNNPQVNKGNNPANNQQNRPPQNRGPQNSGKPHFNKNRNNNRPNNNNPNNKPNTDGPKE